MKKRRPEILWPGLKLQTPIENKKTKLCLTLDMKRWKELMDQPLNKWKPIK